MVANGPRCFFRGYPSWWDNRSRSGLARPGDVIGPEATISARARAWTGCRRSLETEFRRRPQRVGRGSPDQCCKHFSLFNPRSGCRLGLVNQANRQAASFVSASGEEKKRFLTARNAKSTKKDNSDSCFAFFVFLAVILLRLGTAVARVKQRKMLTAVVSRQRTCGEGGGPASSAED